MDEVTLADILSKAHRQRATDVHICCGAPVLLRVDGELVPYNRGKLSAEASRRLSLEWLSDAQRERFERDLDYDFMKADETGRYRVNVGFFNGEIGAVVRILPKEPMTIDQLNLPPAVKYLAGQTKGLVLITGSTSQGKTTTLSAMIDEVNRNRQRHIVTIEDPIEYIHVNKKSVVRQREVGRDTKSFPQGLRAALRQDPNVLAIGEMRDYETIRIALTAAETGVLVLSTLHIIAIDKIIERLLSYSPTEEEGHLRYMLADSLQGIIHQELLPTRDGGKQVAAEVLVVTDAARHIIRRRGAYLLRDVITTGKRFGMFSMVDSVKELLEGGVISEDVANGVLANYRV